MVKRADRVMYHELHDSYESSNVFTSLKVVLPSDIFTGRAFDPWISLAILGFCLSGKLLYSRVIRPLPVG